MFAFVVLDLFFSY